MKVAIIIPAHNEEKRIGKTLESHSSYFEAIRKEGALDYEILVVINNTKDKTESIVKKHAEKNKRVKYLNLKEGGKGYAVLEGFKDALKRENDLIGFVDADLATPSNSLHNLIKGLKDSDGIIASRYLKDSVISPSRTFRRLVIGKGFNLLVRTLFFLPYRDTQCGAKLFTRQATEEITKNVKMSQWAFDVELLYHLYKNKFKIKEAPTIWKEVEGSKINLKKSSAQMLLSIIQLRIIKSPLKGILKPLSPLTNTLWNLTK